MSHQGEMLLSACGCGKDLVRNTENPVNVGPMVGKEEFQLREGSFLGENGP